MSIFDFLESRENVDQAIRKRSLDQLRQQADPTPVGHRLHRNVSFGAVSRTNPSMGVTMAREISFPRRVHIWERASPATRFSLVLSGRGWFVTESIRVPLRAGVFFTRVRGEEHFIVSTSHTPLRMFVVMCAGRLADKLHHELLGPRCMASKIRNQSEAGKLFARILKEADANTEQSQTIAGLHTEILLRKLKVETMAQSPMHTRAYGTFRECRDYINQHAKELTAVGQVVRACHLDLSYLGRLFNRFENMGPHEYLMRVKMSHATDMLLRSDQPVYSIAAQLGFTDAFTFSRAFKRLLGVSPNNYRQGKL